MPVSSINALWKSCRWPICLISFSLLASVLFYISLLFSSSQQSEQSSNIYRQSLIASVNQYEYLPALLSTDALFINTLLNPRLSHLPASEKLHFTAKRSGAEAIYIMNLDGDVIATSNFNNEQSFLNKNYSFRPYFFRAISELKRQFYYAKGATTGIPGFFIATPIFSDQRILGVAVVKLSMEHWESGWQGSTQGIITTDENGIVILSSEDPWRYRTIGALSETLSHQIRELQQFPGVEHTQLYSHQWAMRLFDMLNITFWRIDNTLYISHRFDIPEVQWSLYSLVKHERLLFPTLIFFMICATIALSFYVIRRERKHKLESIHKSRQLELNRKEELKAVIDNIHIGVALFTTDGDLLSINDHANYLLLDGQLPHPGQRIAIDDVVDVDFSQPDEWLLDDVAAPAYHESYTLKGQTRTPVMFALSKVAVMDRPLYLMTVINISRRKSVEEKLVKMNNSLEDTIAQRTEELHQAQATLIQKNKAAALGNMAATIVHELSQPLAAMNSSIAAICTKLEKGDWSGANQSAQRINHISRKMYNVIKLLKYFSYQDSPDDIKADVHKAISGSLDIFEEIVNEHNVIIRYDHCEVELIAKANPLKLDLVFTNIIKNAVEAAEASETPLVYIQTKLKQNQEAEITISDNGGGIDKHIMEQMFSPYFTTKKVGKGLGLGLSITYEIIQEYRGSISVHNTAEGACFTITLPLVEAAKNTATIEPIQAYH